MNETLIVTPNEYLDARQPHWLAAEQAGLVRYDVGLSSVLVKAGPIITALRSAPGATERYGS